MAKVKDAAGLKVVIDVDALTFTHNVREPDGFISRSATFKVGSLPDDIKYRLLVQGASTILQQRVSDIKTGVSDKIDAESIVFGRWMEGEFEAERQGGTRTVPAIIEVLADVKKATVGQVQKAWAKLDKEARDKYLVKYASEIKTLEAQRAESDEIEL